MTKYLGPEMPDVEAEDLVFAERSIAARRRPDPALARYVNRPERGQPAPEIGVLAVKLDRAIEAANAIKRIPAHREIAAIKNGARADEVVDQDSGGRRDDRVVGTKDETAGKIPVVKPVRAGHSNNRRMTFETPFDPFQPLQRCPAVGV